MCELPKIVGPCNSRVEQFWYDAEKDECFTFHWGEVQCLAGYRGNIQGATQSG